ncbi:hypothetical protein TIFTF001_016698 [Ficus carica]|uniref:Uncharacterized protein n=1 Tax=Ficus carica TaxID=3494 RepID=A0AA88ATK0_FICCA|nr:hypothetical protein TIFTF001_016698 [Ficus carica]
MGVVGFELEHKEKFGKNFAPLSREGRLWKSQGERGKVGSSKPNPCVNQGFMVGFDACMSLGIFMLNDDVNGARLGRKINLIKETASSGGNWPVFWKPGFEALRGRIWKNKVECCSVLTGSSSVSDTANKVSNLREVCDARWWSVAGRTVKCGNKCRYAF